MTLAEQIVKILIGYVSAYLPFDSRMNAEILAQLYGVRS